MTVLGYDILAALPELRAQAESMMVDACTVRAVLSVEIDENGAETTIYGPTLYEGRCKVQSTDPLEQNPEAGGASYTVQRYRVDVPVGAFAPAVGQVVTITTATLDPNLAGRDFRVTSLPNKTAATAYRLGVEAVL